MLSKKLMIKGKTREASDALCFKLVTILLYGDLPYILSAGTLAPTTLVVYAPKLRRQLGGRVRNTELFSAFNKLHKWGVLLSVKESFNCFILDLNYPRGFKPAVEHLERAVVTLPSILEGFDPPKRKAKLIEESVKRTLREKK